jgi:hypothetical protein
MATTPTSGQGTVSGIEHHPDLMALRSRQEKTAASPMAQVLEGLTFLAGVYMAISPWVVGYNANAPALTVTNLIVGIAFVALAMGFGSAYERFNHLAWAAPLLGVWMIISQWVVAGSPANASIVINNTVAGGVATLCGLAMMAMAVMGKRRKKT